uniref:Uncharacterized protein n=1 Tax=Siphoviridae sp. ctqSm5 TaxID=2827949 RepID=A0A8S5SQ24_9CAUD|nr:MAG TPA: hypothetical protein [Siphoviridae sp. ctqSm5]
MASNVVFVRYEKSYIFTIKMYSYIFFSVQTYWCGKTI